MTMGLNSNRVFFERVGSGAPDVLEELWITDGTAAGTVLVEDFATVGGREISRLQTWGDAVVFRTIDPSGSSPDGVWISDGTAGGTRPLADLSQPAFAGATDIEEVRTVGSMLVFTVFVPSRWSSGRTDIYVLDEPGGTPRRLDLPSGVTLEQVDTLRPIDGERFAILGDTTDFDEGIVFLSNGTTEGTVRVVDLPEEITALHEAVDGTLFAVDASYTVYRIVEGRAGYVGSFPDDIDFLDSGTFLDDDVVAFAGGFVFEGVAADLTRELWFVDGKTGAASSVASLVGASRPFTVENTAFAVVNGRLLYSGDNGNPFNPEAALRAWDGIGAPRVIPIRLLDGSVAFDGVFARELAVALADGNGFELAFFRSEGRLFASDGTDAFEIAAFDGQPDISLVAVSGGEVLFHVDSGADVGLWRIDAADVLAALDSGADLSARPGLEQIDTSPSVPDWVAAERAPRHPDTAGEPDTHPAEAPVLIATLDEDSVVAVQLAATPTSADQIAIDRLAVDPDGPLDPSAFTFASTGTLVVDGRGREIALPGKQIFDPVSGTITLDAAAIPELQQLRDGERATLTVRFTVTDDAGLSDEGRIQFVVDGRNDAPTIRASDATLDETAKLVAVGTIETGDVEDLRPTPRFPDRVVMLADDQLWVTDGTVAGSELLATFPGFAQSSNAAGVEASLFTAGDEAVFVITAFRPDLADRRNGRRDAASRRRRRDRSRRNDRPDRHQRGQPRRPRERRRRG